MPLLLRELSVGTSRMVTALASTGFRATNVLLRSQPSRLRHRVHVWRRRLRRLEVDLHREYRHSPRSDTEENVRLTFSFLISSRASPLSLPALPPSGPSRTTRRTASGSRRRKPTGSSTRRRSTRACTARLRRFRGPTFGRRSRRGRPTSLSYTTLVVSPLRTRGA